MRSSCSFISSIGMSISDWSSNGRTRIRNSILNFCFYSSILWAMAVLFLPLLPGLFLMLVFCGVFQRNIDKKMAMAKWKTLSGISTQLCVEGGYADKRMWHLHSIIASTKYIFIYLHKLTVRYVLDTESYDSCWNGPGQGIVNTFDRLIIKFSIFCFQFN